jgi:hypothetical protein
VWDVFFNEGSKILFRVALSLLSLSRDALLRSVGQNDLASPLHLMKLICRRVYNPDFLLWVRVILPPRS